jgi:hypothetical protein
VVGPVPPSWNIGLQQGDIISGTFTFEPFDAPSNSSKTNLVVPFDFSIQIKSRTLTTSQYSIEVYNDSTGVEEPAPEDRIIVGCSFFGGPKVCTPRTVALGDPTEWSFAVSFSGDPTALDGADVPADPIAWQRLIFRESMTVAFVDNSAHYYGFSASPHALRVVPEPGAGVLFASFAVLCAFARCCFQFQRRSLKG